MKSILNDLQWSDVLTVEKGAICANYTNIACAIDINCVLK